MPKLLGPRPAHRDKAPPSPATRRFASPRTKKTLKTVNKNPCTYDNNMKYSARSRISWLTDTNLLERLHGFEVVSYQALVPCSARPGPLLARVSVLSSEAVSCGAIRQHGGEGKESENKMKPTSFPPIGACSRSFKRNGFKRSGFMRLNYTTGGRKAQEEVVKTDETVRLIFGMERA